MTAPALTVPGTGLVTPPMSSQEDAGIPGPSAADGGKKRDHKAVEIACDRCREKRRKCDGLTPVCTNCAKARAKNAGKGVEVVCHYQPFVKRRGKKKIPPEGSGTSERPRKQQKTASASDVPTVGHPGTTTSPPLSDVMAGAYALSSLGIPPGEQQPFATPYADLGVLTVSGGPPAGPFAADPGAISNGRAVNRLLRPQDAAGHLRSPSARMDSGDDTSSVCSAETTFITNASALENFLFGQMPTAPTTAPATSSVTAPNFVVTSGAPSSQQHAPQMSRAPQLLDNRSSSNALELVGIPPSSQSYRSRIAYPNENITARFPSFWDLPESIYANPPTPLFSALSEVQLSMGLMTPSTVSASASMFNIASPLSVGPSGGPGHVDQMFAQQQYGLASPTAVHHQQQPHPGMPTLVMLSDDRPQPHPDLTTHLIAVYFTILNTTMPLFREDEFLKDYVPVCKHPPSLVNAMMGAACVFSQHPELYARFKSPSKASEHYMKLAELELDNIQHPMVQSAVLTILGMWDFGYQKSEFSFVWLGKAARLAQMLRLPFPNRHFFRLSIFRDPLRIESEDLLSDVRTRVFSNIFIIDTYASFVSGLPMALTEEDYKDVTIAMERQLENDLAMSGLDPNRGKSSARTKEEEPDPTTVWRETFAELPLGTVFDRPGLPRMATITNRQRPSYCPPYWGWERTPKHLRTSVHDNWYHFHLIFIIRRIIRMITQTNTAVPPNYKCAGPLAVIKKNSLSIKELHQALIDWFANLPDEIKPFNGLEDFLYPSSPTQTSHPQQAAPTAPPPSGPHAPWTRNPITVQTLILFTAAISALHDPTEPHETLYPTSTHPDAPRLPSLRIALLSLRAQAFLIRSVYSCCGHTQPPPPPHTLRWGEVMVALLSETGFTRWNQSSPPMAFAVNPALAFFIYVVGANVIATMVPGAPRVEGGAGFDSGELVDALEQIKSVLFPTLVGVARVWRAGGMYVKALGVLIESVPVSWHRAAA
ncbi:hypothetical protein HK101_003028 [Irineochytrium annulatum]|nr:hypothetical protein HK101_003028 [Irineochytrium annulatum]